jgi:hypothetical protein
MNTKILLSAPALLIAIVLLFFQSQALIIITAIVMAVIIIIALRFLGPGQNMKITRWAKRNPRKTQVFITIGILLAMAVGLTVGFDLRQLGYVFKDITAIVFGGFMMFGFLSIPFLKRRPIFTLPSVIFRDRLAYTVILICVYALSVFSGNRAEDKYPESYFVKVLQAVDKKIFSQQMAEAVFVYQDFEEENNPIIKESSIFPLFTLMMLYEKKVSEPTVSKDEKRLNNKAVEKLKKMEKKMKRRMDRLREMYAAGASAGTILLYILLGLLVCTGICLIIGGFSGGGVGYGILGIFVLAGSIWGIISTSRTNREKRESLQKGSP